MLGLIAKLPIQEGKVEEAIGLFRELIKNVAREEGTLGYTLNRARKTPKTLVVMERYKDKAALDAHSSTPHFQAFMTQVLGILDGNPEITVMEEIDSI